MACWRLRDLIYSGDQALSFARRSTPATEAASETAAWGYTGYKGPLYWGTVYAPGETEEDGSYQSYNLCLNGETQSPISATSINKTQPISWGFTPGKVSGTVINNGHAIAMGSLDGPKLLGNSTLSIGGTQYNLVQLHFHSPSEHRRWVNGTYANFDPVEMHLVHESSSGALAVIGVFITGSGNVNSELKTVEQNLGNGTSVDFNVPNVLPADTGAWTYDGSLTTPPCTEEQGGAHVKWFVMKNPIKVDSTQIDFLRTLYSNNSRGAAFEQVTGQQLHKVSSGEAGVWGVSGSNILYQRTGITDGNMRGTGWKTWLNAVVHVSVGKTGVWIIATSSKGNQVAYTNAQGLLDLVVPAQANITRISAGTPVFGPWTHRARSSIERASPIRFPPVQAGISFPPRSNSRTSRVANLACGACRAATILPATISTSSRAAQPARWRLPAVRHSLGLTAISAGFRLGSLASGPWKLGRVLHR